jgi:O-antigen/teichoic acid export membrane protein
VQIDVFIIANFFEPNEIALYLLIGKVFSLIYFSYNAYLQAIWPKFLEEFLKKNWSAINGLIIKSMKISFLVCFISVSVIFIFIESIILVLSNNELNEISYILFLGFVLVIFVRVWTDIFATFLQSISKTHIFLSSIFLQAIINAYLMITMGKIFGINGIIYALLFSYLLTVAWTLPTYFHYLKKYT